MKTLKNYTTTLPVVAGEYSSKTQYLSWEFQGDQWSQGEFLIAVYNGVKSVIHEVSDENGENAYVVISSLE